MILGIDPGTFCGWGVISPSGARVASGCWNLSVGRHEGGGMRFLRLRGHLAEVLDVMRKAGTPVVAIGYEEVRRHAGTDAAHIYGGVLATLQALCEERTLPYRGVPVGTVKKAATGKGNADKPMMVRAANERFGLELLVRTVDKKGVLTDVTDDDDEADALFVGLTLGEQLGLVKR